MTSSPLPSMYANAAVTFTNPFAHGDNSLDCQSHQRLAQRSFAPSSHAAFINSKRPPTPPPDMNGVTHSTNPSSYNQEHGQRFDGNLGADARMNKHPVAPHTEPNVFAAHTRSTPRPLSPASQSRYVPAHEATGEPDTHRALVPANAIAPSFQIPKTVNDSGGSLSELAAQITCLFWFESSDLLHQVEESSVPITPSRNLVRDAVPTTGFRKWVTTILSTTLVGANVVLLALLFVHRLKRLNPSVRGKPGSEYRLLTVALMLGNKFLDDNTYTNKTWAEVSGINVGEVHIMEVEFLSNMKYCLYTSAEEWAEWQSLLGRFAAFFDRATLPRPPPSNPPAPILPPASSLRLPAALPSPPASTQASPPYSTDFVAGHYSSTGAASHGPTPAPSPHTLLYAGRSNEPASRKRSLEDSTTEPPPPSKRMASGVSVQVPERYSMAPLSSHRHPLPALPLPTSQPLTAGYSMPSSQAQQLPPLAVPGRAMAMVYPASSSSLSTPQSANPLSQTLPQLQPQYQQSRQQSPYAAAASSTVSPTGGLPPPPPSSVMHHPSAQVSPSVFLQQRSSPYRPVHHVSTLLYPPPSAALQQCPQNIEYDQMHFHPLGKSTQPQTGRLPYAGQNVWFDNSHQNSYTTLTQWPPLSSHHQKHPLSNQST